MFRKPKKPEPDYAVAGNIGSMERAELLTQIRERDLGVQPKAFFSVTTGDRCYLAAELPSTLTWEEGAWLAVRRDGVVASFYPTLQLALDSLTSTPRGSRTGAWVMGPYPRDRVGSRATPLTGGLDREKIVRRIADSERLLGPLLEGRFGTSVTQGVINVWPKGAPWPLGEKLWAAVGKEETCWYRDEGTARREARAMGEGGFYAGPFPPDHLLRVVREVFASWGSELSPNGEHVMEVLWAGGILNAHVAAGSPVLPEGDWASVDQETVHWFYSRAEARAHALGASDESFVAGPYPRESVGPESAPSYGSATRKQPAPGTIPGGLGAALVADTVVSITREPDDYSDLLGLIAEASPEGRRRAAPLLAEALRAAARQSEDLGDEVFDLRRDAENRCAEHAAEVERLSGELLDLRRGAETLTLENQSLKGEEALASRKWAVSAETYTAEMLVASHALVALTRHEGSMDNWWLDFREVWAQASLRMKTLEQSGVRCYGTASEFRDGLLALRERLRPEIGRGGPELLGSPPAEGGVRS